MVQRVEAHISAVKIGKIGLLLQTALGLAATVVNWTFILIQLKVFLPPTIVKSEGCYKTICTAVLIII